MKKMEGVNVVSRPGEQFKDLQPPYFKNQNSSGQGAKRDYSKLTCHFCKEPEHIKPICPKWKKLIATAMTSQPEEQPSSSNGSLSLQKIVRSFYNPFSNEEFPEPLCLLPHHPVRHLGF